MTLKRALVTGASAGIGREFARQLAAQGYAVVCVARREEALRALVAELPGTGHVVLAADLASEPGVQSVAQHLTQQPVNLLVNNAGFSVLEPFYQSSLEQQQNILQVNCAAVLCLAHAFLQQAQPGDALINVASVVTYLPTPAQPMYSASKAFVGALSECLWDEHRSRGVYVMGLCPGVTQTDFIKTATGGESDGENLPAPLVQSCEAVVGEALGALRKRKKSIVVTGWINKLMLLLPRVLTRHRLIKTMAVIGDPDNAL